MFYIGNVTVSQYVEVMISVKLNTKFREMLDSHKHVRTES